MRAPDLAAERALWGAGVGLIAGIDEVGRGPLAGPVAAGAVILPQLPRITGRFRWLSRVRDSKQLLPAAREELAEYIWEFAFAAGVAFVSVSAIDRIGMPRRRARRCLVPRRTRRATPAPPNRCLSPACLPLASNADHRR